MAEAAGGAALGVLVVVAAALFVRRTDVNLLWTLAAGGAVGLLAM